MTLGLIESAADAKRFIFAGSATFTIVSKKTKNRYTFKAKRARHDSKRQFAPSFIRLVTGPNTKTDNEYIGYIVENLLLKGMIPGNAGNPSHPAYKAMDWVVKNFQAGKMPNDLEFYHAGRCGKCNRELTVPESIKSGIGPVCDKTLTKRLIHS